MEQYIIDSLTWMRFAGIAASIEAIAVRGSRKDEINFAVRINRKNADNVFFKFFANWEEQIIGGIAA